MSNSSDAAPGCESLIPDRDAFVSDPDFVLYVGDVREVLRELPDESVHCCVTSPPYWGLRDYGHDGQLGLESTPEEYMARMVAVFREVRRVLRSDGTCWLNIGDSYTAGMGSRNGLNSSGLKRNVQDEAERLRCLKENKVYRSQPLASLSTGLKPKDLVGIPWRLAFALQADGWYLRSDIIWSKPNPMPESVTDRPTKAHEYLFLLTKSARYFFDQEAVRAPHSGRPSGNIVSTRVQTGGTPVKHSIPWTPSEIGRNIRSVWEIATEAYPEAHFATFPQALVEPCIKAGCPEGGTVLDPFMGSGTTALVARRLGRKAVGIELNEEYAELCARRLGQQSLLAEPAA